MDGEVSTVKISPVGNEGHEAAAAVLEDKSKSHQSPAKAPEGAVFCDMAGLVLSLEVKVGDTVGKGDLLAVVEAMKMRRPLHSPRAGTIKEIFAEEGQTLDAEDILMVVQ